MSYESLSHSKRECTYHVVLVPKYRKKVLYSKVRKFLGPVFRELASHKRCKIVKGRMVQDHVRMMIAIPPKFSVAEVVGYIKGKSAIAVARQFGGVKETSMEKNCGHEAMLCRQLVLKKKKLLSM